MGFSPPWGGEAIDSHGKVRAREKSRYCESGFRHFSIAQDGKKQRRGGRYEQSKEMGNEEFLGTKSSYYK